MLKLNVVIKKLSDQAVIPTTGSDDAAGYDLYACLQKEKITIKPGETIKIGTGICMQLPTTTFGAVFARSGLATKQGLRPANCVGVIDSDYRGEIIVAIHNDSDMNRVIRHGDRVAQLVVLPYFKVSFVEGELDDTNRGTGGFGSTGVSNLDCVNLSQVLEDVKNIETNQSLNYVRDCIDNLWSTAF